MAILIKEQGDESKPWIDYPKLMQDQEGDIFYMIRENYGLPLTGGDDWNFEDENIADFSDDGWRTFTDYNKPITIQNKY